MRVCAAPRGAAGAHGGDGSPEMAREIGSDSDRHMTAAQEICAQGDLTLAAKAARR